MKFASTHRQNLRKGETDWTRMDLLRFRYARNGPVLTFDTNGYLLAGNSSHSLGACYRAQRLTACVR